jgi:ubiquinone/menaquinone biosynthesis C-methylase UbiE
MKKKTREKEYEIINDFQGKIKDRTIKINFLKKIANANVFVSKKTGSLIPGNYYNKNKNLAVWEKKYKNKIYSSKSEHFASRHIYILKFFERHFKLKKKIIADLGCGDAGLITLLNNLYNPKKIYGFESSKKNCLNNRKKIKEKKIKFINCDIESINEDKFKDKFDIVFLTWTLSSCSNPLELLKKVFKILKYGGYVVVAESSRIMVTPKNSILYYFPKKYNTFLHYPWRFSFNSLSNILTLNNLKVISNNDYNNNDNLVLIAKKTFFKKKYVFDNYKKLIFFFRTWKLFSRKFSNI